MDQYIRNVTYKVNDLQEQIETGHKTIELLNESYKLGHELPKILFEKCRHIKLKKLLGEQEFDKIYQICKKISSFKLKNTPTWTNIIDNFFKDWYRIQTQVISILNNLQGIIDKIGSIAIIASSQKKIEVAESQRIEIIKNTMQLITNLYHRGENSKVLLNDKYYKDVIIPCGIREDINMQGNVQIAPDSYEESGRDLYILLNFFKILNITRKLIITFEEEEIAEKFLRFYCENNEKQKKFDYNFKKILHNMAYIFLKTYYNEKTMDIYEEFTKKLDLLNSTLIIDDPIKNFSKIEIQINIPFEYSLDLYVLFKDAFEKNEFSTTSASNTISSNAKIDENYKKELSALIQNLELNTTQSNTFQVNTEINNWEFFNSPLIYSNNKKNPNFYHNWDIIQDSKTDIDIIRLANTLLYSLHANKSSLPNASGVNSWEKSYKYSLSYYIKNLIDIQNMKMTYNNTTHQIILCECNSLVKDAEENLNNISVIINNKIKKKNDEINISQHEKMAYSTSLFKSPEVKFDM